MAKLSKPMRERGVGAREMTLEDVDEDFSALGIDPVRPYGVVAVDPVGIFRRGLELLLARDARFELLDQAGDATAGLRKLKTLGRHSDVVVVVYLAIPGPSDAFWMIRRIREELPTFKVLAIASNADWMTISRALFVGAHGFVDKNCDEEAFMRAIYDCARGEVVLSGLDTEDIGPIARGIDQERTNGEVLTERQREVLTLAAEGLTARDIGGRLGLRERTITTHLENIYKRLGVHGRVAAISLAARSGLVTPRSDD